MMIVDLLVGITASLIASGIVGFFGNKAISKHNNTIMKIYVLFLSAFVFFVSAELSILLNDSILERVLKMNENTIVAFYRNSIFSLGGQFFVVAFVTGIVLLIEAINRSSTRDHKQDMDRYKALK